jgi:hypothetical protein
LGALELALEGHFTIHHRFQLRRLMDLLTFTETQITKIEGEIRQRITEVPTQGNGQPLQTALELRKTIPGIDETTAGVSKYAFRFNRRKSKIRGKLFFRLVEQGLATSPEPYHAIINPGKFSQKATQPVGVG